MFSYFSILPVRFKESDDLSKPSILASMLFWLPVGGLVLGTLSMLLYRILFPLEWVAGVIAAVSYMMLYGFLHTEAIMDVADALYAKHAGKDAFAVIKESTVGAMGVLWAVALMLLKVSAIVFLLNYEAYGLFLSALIISRLGLLLLFFTQSFRSSFITTMQQGFDKYYFAGSLLLFTTIGALLSGWHFFILLLIGLGVAYLISTTLAKKLGFMNGDVLGTTLESTEIVLMLIGGALWL
jgi:adenosylcobinamide-GDP ribazoletransferase